MRAINPRILFLMETKISPKKMEAIRRKCRFGNVIDVVAIDSKGGLLLGWKDNSLVTLRNFSQHHIDVDIKDNEIEEM